MNDLIVNEITYMKFNKYPDKIRRFEIGLGSYVYQIGIEQNTFVMRLTDKKDMYKHTVYWLDKLQNIVIHRLLGLGNAFLHEITGSLGTDRYLHRIKRYFPCALRQVLRSIVHLVVRRPRGVRRA